MFDIARPLYGYLRAFLHIKRKPITMKTMTRKYKMKTKPQSSKRKLKKKYAKNSPCDTVGLEPSKNAPVYIRANALTAQPWEER